MSVFSLELEEKLDELIEDSEELIDMEEGGDTVEDTGFVVDAVGADASFISVSVKSKPGWSWKINMTS